LLIVVIDPEALEATGVHVEWPSGDGSGPHLLGAIPPGDPAVVVDVCPVTRAGDRWIAPIGAEE
jgi:uncharacterized Zn-binding protein involved in type VI secretion